MIDCLLLDGMLRVWMKWSHNYLLPWFLSHLPVGCLEIIYANFYFGLKENNVIYVFNSYAVTSTLLIFVRLSTLQFYLLWLLFISIPNLHVKEFGMEGVHSFSSLESMCVHDPVWLSKKWGVCWELPKLLYRCIIILHGTSYALINH